MEDAVYLSLYQKVLRIFDETRIEDDVFKGFGIHEVVAVAIDVAILKLYHVGVHDFDGVRGADLRVGAGAGVEVAHGDLHEAGLATLSAVLHVEHEVRSALIVEDLAFANVCG